MAFLFGRRQRSASDLIRSTKDLLQRLILWCRTLSRLQLVLVAAVLTMGLVGIPFFAARGGWVQGFFVTAALLKLMGGGGGRDGPPPGFRPVPAADSPH